MDLKLIHCTLPRFCRHEPFLLGVAQGKKEELGSGVIAREVALGADDFTQLEVEGLDCIGRVEDASDLVGEGKEAGRTRSQLRRQEATTWRGCRARAWLVNQRGRAVPRRRFA